MIAQLPIWIDILFICSFVVTIVLFYYSNGKPYKLTSLILLWSLIHCVLAFNGFYHNITAMPPRFGLVLIPVFVVLLYSFFGRQRQWFLDNRNTKISTFLHIIRLPVEIVLLQLFIHNMIPELLTFEGRNFDIIAGLTAPIVGVLYLKKWIGNRALLVWNVLGLILILFVYTNGILSSELPFQQFGYDQPNRAMTYFPFILLPATIVPIVIWTHISDIIKLSAGLRTN